jgi:hypothetical protein
VAGRNGARDFGRNKVAVRADESDQVTIAVAGGTVASDEYSSDAVRIGNMARGSGEVLNFVRHVAGGRVAG